MSDAELKREERQMRTLARDAVLHHFGSKPSRLIRLAGGLTNFVFRAVHAEGAFIIRLNSDPVKLNQYLKEQWAIARASEVGVPTAEVLEVGNQIGAPYMISRATEGEAATDHPLRLEIVEEIGRILACLHKVKTCGFGETFDWSQNQLSRVDHWADYLRDQLHVDTRIGLLRDEEFITKEQARALERELEKLARSRADPVLNHGDPRFKNVLVDKSGEAVAVLDWEFALSALPVWDLSLALHDLSIDQKQAFLTGYGLNDDDIRELAPTWKTLNIINYAPFVEEALREEDCEKLSRVRIRMSGALDLYSL